MRENFYHARDGARFGKIETGDAAARDSARH
jgi:hypothetical protein